MPNALYVGVDLSGRFNVAQFMTAEGDTVRKPLEFDNDRVGLDRLLDALTRLCDAHAIDSLHIGMEATGFYWWHLREALREHTLEGVTIRVYVINPALVKGFKKAYTRLPKTDAVDAWVIADRLRFGRLRPVGDLDLRYTALARLTRFRFTMKKQIRATKNRACNLVFLKFSAYGDAAGRRFFGKASLDVLNELTLDEIVDMPLEELAAFIVDHGNNRFEGPDDYAQELKAAARRSYRLNAKMQDSVDVALAMSCQNLRFFEGQCKKLDKAIEAQLGAIPQTLQSVPGIGPVLAAGITAEIGDIHRFDSHSGLAKFSGLVWNRHQSGDFEAEETSLTKAGNKYLRYYLVEAANSLRLHNPDYAAFYQRKHDEVSKHQHKRALVLTARKFVRLVYALLSKGQIYRPEVRS